MRGVPVWSGTAHSGIGRNIPNRTPSFNQPSLSWMTHVLRWIWQWWLWWKWPDPLRSFQNSTPRSSSQPQSYFRAWHILDRRKTALQLWVERYVWSSVYHEFHKFRQANEKLSILNCPFRDFFPTYATDCKNLEYILSNLRLTVISLSGRRLIITSTGTLALLPKQRNRETLSMFSLGAVFLSFFAHIANFTKLQANVTFMVLWMAKFWVWKEPGMLSAIVYALLG